MCTSETSFSLLLNFNYTNKNGLSSKKLHFAFSIVVALTRMYFLCIEGGIPVKTVAIAVGAGVLGAGATVALAPVVLAAAGFTGAGVAAGSLAASLMSSMGPIAAGSTFAALQSAGATGVIGATAPTVAGVVTGAAGGIGAHLWSRKKKGDGNNGKGPGGPDSGAGGQAPEHTEETGDSKGKFSVQEEGGDEVEEKEEKEGKHTQEHEDEKEKKAD